MVAAQKKPLSLSFASSISLYLSPPPVIPSQLFQLWPTCCTCPKRPSIMASMNKSNNS